MSQDYGKGGKPKKKNGGKKKRKGARIFLAVVLVIAILLGAVFAYGYSMLGKISYDSIKM